jgi:dUTP pyrophosphatase
MVTGSGLPWSPGEQFVTQNSIEEPSASITSAPAEPEWRPWPGGNWFGPGCSAHLYTLHANAAHDMRIKAEKAWHAQVPDSGYQVMHMHAAEDTCNGGCSYFHDHPVDAPPPPEVDADGGLIVAWSGPVKVKAYHPNAAMPQRAYELDAGYDLTYPGPDDITIEPGECEDVCCGVAIQWPDGVWGFLVGRSSTFRQRGIMVNPAITDGGFRGELFAVCRNIGNRTVTVKPGERVAQIIPMPLLADTFAAPIEVEELDPSERGMNGFGSSGA